MAGVSTATISKYLNGVAVKEKNRISIEKAIKELGFKPNQFARNLRNNKSMTIGVLLPELSNIFSTTIISALENELMIRGYSTIICDYHSNPKQETEKLDFLIGKKVDAVVVMPTSLIAKDMINLEIPVILIDRKIKGGCFDSILIDNEKAAYLAAAELIECGHRKIGIICGGISIYTTIKRLEGYKNAFSDNGLTVDEQYIFHGDYSKESGYELTKKMLSMDSPPTAIFATNYETTAGAIFALNEEGLSIPDDISFIGFDNLDAAQIYRPNLSVVVQPIEAIATTVSEILLERLSNESTDNRKTVILEPKFIKNKSILRLGVILFPSLEIETV